MCVHDKKLMDHRCAFFVPCVQDQFSPDQNRQNQQLFEDQQQMLESEVERLSSLVRDTHTDALMHNMHIHTHA